MKYALNLEPESGGDAFEMDEFEDEATDNFWELDGNPGYECGSSAEFDTELGEAEWEAEIRRGQRMPMRPTRLRPAAYRRSGPSGQPKPRGDYPFHKHGKYRRWPAGVITAPHSCTCPALNCPRHGSEYVRWVQNTLNQVLGLRLPVTGIMNPAARSAVRSFQQRQGLPVDGIAGPDTERALIAVRSGKSPGSVAAKHAETDMVTPLASAKVPLTAEFDFEFERPEAAGERQRKALAKRLQNTPVGRALTKMGANITIEKAPPLHPAHWVRGLSGFEVRCGGQRNINVVFGLFDQQKKMLAWYLFSSTVDLRSKLACKRSGSRPVVRPFGVASAVATFTPNLQKKSQIDVSELVRDAKGPSATMLLDTKIDKNRITCRLDKLNTKSNGLVHLTFGLIKVSEPSSANVAIPGKLFFLDVESFDEEKFREPPVLDPRRILGPQAIAERKALSLF
ncbi:peptidoglycan-binding domain-containing protein [Nitrosomonas communis]|uniref:Putative peptidoglycan binding domain-containing protein n=1 Tax=Nitrosomonas communis TaxID=44574 RepID=A0A1H2RBH5_9PROT|nr:peptidoglycan-binding domain-containing protein [Nitrosomonas communis]SDW16194.1 Putative peptidoglycan binding domain-containing protein [Nitrosomonas communis]